MGETRDERIAEFCAMNPDEIVVAIREGSYLYIQGEGSYVITALKNRRL